MLFKDHMFLHEWDAKPGDEVAGLCGKGGPNVWPPKKEEQGWPLKWWQRPCRKCVQKFAEEFDKAIKSADDRLTAVERIEQIARETQ